MNESEWKWRYTVVATNKRGLTMKSDFLQTDIFTNLQHSVSGKIKGTFRSSQKIMKHYCTPEDKEILSLGGRGVR